MSRSGVETSMVAADPRVERLLELEDSERESAIGDLIATVARPQARRAISRYAHGEGLTVEDAEDVVAIVEMRLLAKLRTISADDDAILDFEQYVARLAFNILSDHFRRRFPQRTRLKNRLRYTLTHDPRLALWTAADRLACGLGEWRGAPASRAVPLAIPARRERRSPAAALLAIFRSHATPVDFEDLVDRLAEDWHVVDAPRLETSPLLVPPVDEDFEVRELLTALWREVLDLRPMQRKALLLNLRDAETAHVLSLFVLSHVATIDAIAAALEMSREALEALWNDLPLDDLRIAAMLGVTRQQVINLRKSARERLTRRVGKRRAS